MTSSPRIAILRGSFQRKRLVAAAMRLNPFRGVDFAKVARTNRLCNRKFALDERCRLRLAKTRQRTCNLLFRSVVSGYDGCSCLHRRCKACRLPSHHLAVMIPDNPVS